MKCYIYLHPVVVQGVHSRT